MLAVTVTFSVATVAAMTKPFKVPLNAEFSGSALTVKVCDPSAVCKFVPTGIMDWLVVVNRVKVTCPVDGTEPSRTKPKSAPQLSASDPVLVANRVSVRT